MKKFAKELESNLPSKNVEIQAVTVKFDTPYVSMAEAIAEKFGEARISILKKVIEQGISELFFSFDDSYREELAELADKKTTSFMLSKGASCSSMSHLGNLEDEWTEWRMTLFNRQLNEHALKILDANEDIDIDEAMRLAIADYHKNKDESDERRGE